MNSNSKKIQCKRNGIGFFTEGWKEYRGCKIEHGCAVQYGIEIVCY